MVQNDPSFFQYVFLLDESKFYSDGQLNRHNCHYCSNENPHWDRPMDDGSSTSMECYGVVRNSKWLFSYPQSEIGVLFQEKGLTSIWP